MSNIEVYVICEGVTEQTFIREVLAPEMSAKGIHLHPALIGKPGHKGGDIRFERAKTDICNFLKQRSDTCVSTFMDYFRLEKSWPGNEDIPQNISADKKAQRVENATLKEIERTLGDIDVTRRFIPYIQMYEFEALLFSNAGILAEGIRVDAGCIESILQECGEPEEINDGADTAPSKRLKLLRKDYRKVGMGTEISKKIGISAIRDKCRHFDAWLRRLELLDNG